MVAFIMTLIVGFASMIVGGVIARNSSSTADLASLFDLPVILVPGGVTLPPEQGEDAVP